MSIFNKALRFRTNIGNNWHRNKVIAGEYWGVVDSENPKEEVQNRTWILELFESGSDFYPIVEAGEMTISNNFTSSICNGSRSGKISIFIRLRLAKKRFDNFRTSFKPTSWYIQRDYPLRTWNWSKRCTRVRRTCMPRAAGRIDTTDGKCGTICISLFETFRQWELEIEDTFRQILGGYKVQRERRSMRRQVWSRTWCGL